jgi:hypothetical protein
MLPLKNKNKNKREHFWVFNQKMGEIKKRKLLGCK